MPKQITHLIIGLSKDGAETMLYQVLKYSSKTKGTLQVISLGEGDYYFPLIQELGIDVFELPLRKHPFSTVFRLGKLLKGTNTLCCWMYHANLLGAIVGKAVGVKRIVWNIRHSNLDPKYNKHLSLFINSICAKMSSKIDVIAYNGEKARQVHEESGYCKNKSIVLDNGVDCEAFCPGEEAEKSVRSELGISANKRIVLSVSRYDPIKDIPTFIEAFAKLHQIMPNTVAVMCGRGITTDNQQITSCCQKNQLVHGKDIYLLGMRYDIPRMMAGCDLYVLHSAGEAFPNTLIQAMSCGCVCVSTDVGDARRILDDDNWIVPAQDREKLCSAMKRAMEMMAEEKKTVSKKNRDCIIQNYSIIEAVKQYDVLY